ncbi:MAG: hypothetical protein IJU50_02255 [Lachnospiraceae bacterium]|nr:hypothetical protein [Lachnospiraceae bacterium]
MKRQWLLGIMGAAVALSLAACGGSGSGNAQTEETKTETAEAETKSVPEEAEKEPETEAGETGTGESTTEASGDEGKYIVFEYEANGQKVSHDMLEASGMSDTYLWLKPGGEAELYLFSQSVDATWKPGVVTAYGTSDYSYEIEGDTLTLDMAGVTYVMKRDASASGGAAQAAKPAEEAEEAPSEGGAPEAGTPQDAPGGDGIVSEEMVQKGYVWLNKVKKDVFNTTYEELAEYFGTEGAFDKEEYSEHMKVNKRYYKWISSDDSTHFLYVNFEEKEPGVYKVSSFNTSGFNGTDAVEKYLDELQQEAKEADKAGAANMEMKDFSADIHPWGDKETTVTVSMKIPASGWAYDEQKAHLVENEDINSFGAGFIQLKLEKDVEKFDFYKNDFENYKDIPDREIGGVKFAGRTYKNIGYEWTEYIAQLEDGKAVSIGIVRVDIDEGTTGDKILSSITFK